MKKNKSIFIPCPKCWGRNYEWDSMSADDKNGLWIFNIKCSKCGQLFSNKTELNKQFNQSEMPMDTEFMKKILNPQTLAQMTKKVQEEMDKND